MSSRFNIQLHHLRFFEAHGLFAEEALAGNEFEVNISLSVKAPATAVVAIEDTINYAEVYELVKMLFAVRHDLLETLAVEIATTLKEKFPAIRKIAVQVCKLHPPIKAFTGSVSVTYKRKFKN